MIKSVKYKKNRNSDIWEQSSVGYYTDNCKLCQLISDNKKEMYNFDEEGRPVMEVTSQSRGNIRSIYSYKYDESGYVVYRKAALTRGEDYILIEDNYVLNEDHKVVKLERVYKLKEDEPIKYTATYNYKEDDKSYEAEDSYGSIETLTYSEDGRTAHFRGTVLEDRAYPEGLTYLELYRYSSDNTIFEGDIELNSDGHRTSVEIAKNKEKTYYDIVGNVIKFQQWHEDRLVSSEEYRYTLDRKVKREIVNGVDREYSYDSETGLVDKERCTYTSYANGKPIKVVDEYKYEIDKKYNIQ